MFFLKQLKARKGRKSLRHLRAIKTTKAPDNTISDNSSSTASASTSTSNAIDVIVLALRDAQFESYLKGDMGGSKNEINANRILKNTARFLSWTYNYVHNIPLPPRETVGWLDSIILQHYTMLSTYTSHCITKLTFSPATIKNHLGDILVACEWYVVYANPVGILPVAALFKLKHVAKTIRKAQTKREKETRARNTMDNQVHIRRMPSGGLAELQRAVDRRLPWAAQLSTRIMDKETYRLFMGLLYSALYVYSVQGRISGVMDLNYGQASELLTSGYCTTDQFKTRDRWGLQPVTLSTVTQKLLTQYMNYVRPTACTTSRPSSDDPLWLRFDGSPDAHIGVRLTAFFKKELGLHITTTSIRSLIETTFDTLHVQGVITAQQRASVSNINGHTGEVARDYYVRQSRGADVEHARDAFAQLLEADSASSPTPLVTAGRLPSALPLPQPSLVARELELVMSEESPSLEEPIWTVRARAQPIDFGTQHPDYKSKSIKAQWTDEELNYVGEWCTTTLAHNPSTSNVVAKCRDHIMKDPAAWPIFHSIHVLDSGRLRNGYRAWQTRGRMMDPENPHYHL